jgi:hypothetical protein
VLEYDAAGFLVHGGIIASQLVGELAAKFEVVAISNDIPVATWFLEQQVTYRTSY